MTFTPPHQCIIVYSLKGKERGKESCESETMFLDREPCEVETMFSDKGAIRVRDHVLKQGSHTSQRPCSQTWKLRAKDHVLRHVNCELKTILIRFQLD